MSNLFSIRDREYLRACFALGASNAGVGPVALAKRMGVTKVCAYQKMRRLEALGLGEYIGRAGLKLNAAGVSAVKSDIRRHHMLEEFLIDTLKMDHEEACAESSKMNDHMSMRVIEGINKRLKSPACKCDDCAEHADDLKSLEGCHWLRGKDTIA